VEKVTKPEQRPYLAEEEMEIDLRHLLGVLKKRSKLIIAGTLLCALSAGLFSWFLIPPTYQAQTLLMVTQATDKLQTVEQSEGLDNVVGSISTIPVLTMNTYLGQIKSEVVMQRVIKKLNLDPNLYTPAVLAGKINATIVKDSNLIDIKVTHGDPVMASKIANALSEEYLNVMTEKNQEQMTRSVTFLEEQQKIADKELEKAAEALKKYQSQDRSVEVMELELTSKSNDLTTCNSRLQIVQVEIQQLMAGISSLEQDLAAISPVIPVQKWDESSGQTVTVQDSNPLYITLSQQLAEKRATLAEKQGESAGLQAVVAALNQEINSLQADLAAKKLEQEKLQRELDRLKATSETLAAKTTETRIARSMDIGNTSVMVISQASIPNSPIKPNKKMNVAIALVLGLMAFTLLAFVLDFLDNTLKTTDDISRELGLPVLGVIPLASNQSTRLNKEKQDG
jgi:succinoglycan biosynthesis transport protein ExoP